MLLSPILCDGVVEFQAIVLFYEALASPPWGEGSNDKRTWTLRLRARFILNGK